MPETLIQPASHKQGLVHLNRSWVGAATADAQRLQELDGCRNAEVLTRIQAPSLRVAFWEEL